MFLGAFLFCAQLPVFGEDWKTVIEDNFAVSADRPAGSPLGKTGAEKGGGAWRTFGNAAQFVISPEGQVANGNIAGGKMAALLDCAPQGSDKIKLEADIQLGSAQWLGMGFSKGDDLFWSKETPGQLWLVITSAGHVQIFANGTSKVLKGVKPTEYGFDPDKAAHAELVYDRTANSVTVTLNGQNALNALPLGDFKPEIKTVGIMDNFPVPNDPKMRVDNFKVSLQNSALAEPETGGGKTVTLMDSPFQRPNTGADRGIPWEIDLLKKTPKVFPAPEVAVEGLQSLYFEGLPYRGKTTRVFALYGLPANVQGRKVPGIVLVHGGYGTAYADWVKLWNSRGYAAIAFDHFGGIPLKNASGTGWQSHPDAGPSQSANGWKDEPPTDQWMYHAVADTMLATSLLASFPEVDGNKIGVTGISWGGVVSCIAAGLDDRLKYAAPVYGCGFISFDSRDGSQFVGATQSPEKVKRWRELWDPARYLPSARLPMLWVDGTNDFAFTLRALQSSYLAAPGPRTLSTRVRMQHGHGGPGESPEEIRAFADSIVNGGTPLARITGQGMENGEAWVEYQSGIPLASATLNFTRDSGTWQKLLWESLPATVDEARRRASARVPDGATAWFINLADKRNLIVSGELQTPQPIGATSSSDPSTHHENP